MDLGQIAEALALENVAVSETAITSSCPLAKWTHEKGFDSSPSFGISAKPDGAIVFHCFSCKEKGTLKQLINKLKKYGQEVPEELQKLKVSVVKDHREAGILHKHLLNEQVYLHVFEPASEFGDALKYSKERGVSIETLDRLNIRYDPISRRLIFLVYDDKRRLVGFCGRAVDKDNQLKVLNKLGMPTSLVFLGMHKVRVNKPIILVEGLFMYLKLHELGFDRDYNILAALGSSLSASKRQYLIGLGLPLFLFFDNDRAGNLGAYGVESQESIQDMFKGDGIKGVASELCKYLVVKRVVYPEGMYDPDVLPKEVIEEMLKNAKIMRKVS